MQLNISTDYAIRIILYLAKNKQVVSSGKLSKVIRVSPRYLLQIGARLRDADLIATVYGPTGGYSLTKSPEQINLYDIITIMEGKTQLRQQPVPESDNLQEFIALNNVYKYMENNMEQSLRSITIERLLSQPVDELSIIFKTGSHNETKQLC